jgi:serine/threonine protein kinase
MQPSTAPPELLERFRFERVIGKGGFGEVWLANDTSVERCVAVKVVPLFLLDLEKQTQARREVIILAALRNGLNSIQDHRHRQQLDKFVELFDCIEDHEKNVLYLVQEAMDGDLLQWMCPGGRMRMLSEKTIAGIIFDVLTGLIIMHNNNMAHRDIKLENILYRVDPSARNMTFKIADFGLAKIIGGTNTPVGTPMYVAPEVMQAYNSRRIGQDAPVTDAKPADMWSLGVMLYILLIGSPVKRPELLRRVQQGQLFQKECCRRSVSDNAQRMVLRLLDLEPSERDSAAQAACNVFFRENGFDFGQVSAALDPRAVASAETPLRSVVASPADIFEILPAGSDPAAELADTHQAPDE